MNINEIVNIIVNSVNKNQPVLNQVRYAYVELGKYIQKDTDFFFSVDGKLGKHNLTFDEIEQIYNQNEPLSTQVICRSSSVILKMILDRLGIESKLVKSINNVMGFNEGDRSIEINHWFLAVKDSDGEWFFCTLSSDLPYIQMGMETKHFGVNISYKKELNDGTFSQVYEGEEITNKVIGKDELKEIDKDIGYIKTIYPFDDNFKISEEGTKQYENASLYMLREEARSNRLFNELELDKTDFIKDTYEFIGSDGNKISFYDRSISSLKEKDWEIWLKIICNHVLKKIWKIIGYEVYPLPTLESKDWNYDSWLFSLSVLLEDEIYNRLDLKDSSYMDDRLFIDVTDFKYNKWSKKVKSTFSFNKDYEYENIILILDKLNALVNYVLGRSKNGNLNSLFRNLSLHFIDPKDMYINNIGDDGKLSNYYIANKFSLMFPRVFSCNECRTQFNDMSYSEQVVIIKELLGIMFPEITINNSSMISDYDNRFSPVLNRIQGFPVKNNETGEYALVMAILGEEKDNEQSEDVDEYYYFFDLKSNEFKVCDILEVYRNYTIVSSRMKNKFSVEDLENLENQRKK